MRWKFASYGVPLLVLLAVLGLIAHAVRNRKTDPFQPKTDNTLRRWLYSDPGYLNPILRTSVNASYVLDYVNKSLLTWDMAKDKDKPDLATRWEISDDGLDYTFPLRTDVRWQDGVPFDAQDVAYSFKTVMDPDLPQAGHMRSDFMDAIILRTAPEEDGDGDIAADEYAAVRLADLPKLAVAPVMDGTPESGAAMVATGSGCEVVAALVDGKLYLGGTRQLPWDTTIFVAKQPGKMTPYGPNAKIAQWDAYLLADEGNTYPGRSGWSGPAAARIEGATFAVGEHGVEGIVDLHQLLDLKVDAPLPETLYVALGIIDGARLEVLDRYTVRFHFPHKVYTNLEAAGYLPLVAEHYYNDGQKFIKSDKRDKPLGTGPYKFVKWDRNSQIVLERWDDYWGRKKPKIQRVEFKIIGDGVVAYQVFRKGDLDVMNVGTWTYTRKSVGKTFTKHFYKLNYDRPGYSYVGWNCNRSFFSDPRCRRAMSHLIDVEAACKSVLFGLYTPVTGPFFYGEPAYDSTLPLYRFDLAKARQLLDEAGWIDHDGDGIRDKDLDGDGIIAGKPLDATGAGNLREKFIFDFLGAGNGLDAANDWIALSYARNCPKVGIKCTLRNVEYAIRMDWLREKRYDAAPGGWVFGLDNDPYYFFHSSQAKDGFNYSGYASPEADQLMETARQELDPDRRALLFRKVHRKLYEDQPYTFLVGHNWRWVLNKRFKNVKQYSLGFEFQDWVLAGHEDGN